MFIILRINIPSHSNKYKARKTDKNSCIYLENSFEPGTVVEGLTNDGSQPAIEIQNGFLKALIVLGKSLK